MNSSCRAEGLGAVAGGPVRRPVVTSAEVWFLSGGTVSLSEQHCWAPLGARLQTSGLVLKLKAWGWGRRLRVRWCSRRRRRQGQAEEDSSAAWEWAGEYEVRLRL